MQAIYQEKFTIPSYLIDPNRQLTLVGLLQLFQEVSYTHVSSGGFDDSMMQELGFVWVLNRLRVQLHQKLPRWREQVYVKTWVSRGTPPFFIRNYEMGYVESNEVIAVACSLWILIDIKNRRPIRQFDNRNFPYLIDQHASCGQAEKIKLPVSFDENQAQYYTIRHSDLDIASHFNNTQYVSMALNTLANAPIHYEQLEINYNQEALLNDNLKIRSAVENDTLFFKIEKNDMLVCSITLKEQTSI